MTTASGASSSPPCPCPDRPVSCFEALYEVLILEEWFEERPPLAFAAAHPLTRLYCEMWRTSCTSDLEHCTTTATSCHTPTPRTTRQQRDAFHATARQQAGHNTFSPPLSVSVGRARVPNPTAVADPPVYGAAGVPRPALMSAAAVFAQSPFYTTGRWGGDATSLVRPLTTAGACGAHTAVDAHRFRQRWRPCRTPVVDPSNPLFTLETYAAQVFSLPIGMKLGHLRIVTCAVPNTEGWDDDKNEDGEAVQLVRGLFAHVPAAASLSASKRAAAAIYAVAAQARAEEMADEKIKKTSPPPPPPLLLSVSGVCGATQSLVSGSAAAAAAVMVESDSDDASVSTLPGAAMTEAATKGGSDAPAVRRDEDAVVVCDDVEEEDDWETAALLEEAALGLTSPSPAVAAVVYTSPSPTAAPRPASANQARKQTATTLPASSAAPATETFPLSVSTAQAADEAAQQPGLLGQRIQRSLYAAQLSATCAVLESVQSVLPPPSDWWLRRAVVAAGQAPSTTQSVLQLPLYVHCVEATKQWVDWVDALQRLPQNTPAAPQHARHESSEQHHKANDDSSTHSSISAAGRGVELRGVELRGVSLSGWSSAHVQATLIPRLELDRANVPVRIEEALPPSLPLRGLHLEASLKTLTSLFCRPEVSAVWQRSLVALDIPYIRDADANANGRDGRSPEALASHQQQQQQQQQLFSHLLQSLRQLRYLSLSRSSVTVACDALAERTAHDEDTHSCNGVDDEGSLNVLPLDELVLLGVADISTSALAFVGRRCVFLTLLDLTSTKIRDDDLAALVLGRWPSRSPTHASDTSTSIRAECYSTQLVWLEELRLAACHELTRVRVLSALPRLRRLNLQASAVRSLDDLLGCVALEEVNVTRCEHILQLTALWQLPSLRCVEAAGVSRLLPDGGLLPRPEPVPHRGAVVQAVDAADVAASALAAPLVRLNLAHAASVHGVAVGCLAALLRDWGGRLHSLTVLLLDHTAVGDDTVEALVGHFDDLTVAAAATSPVAAALQELSLVGCLGVHRLGPLGLLPQLRRVVADGSGVEQLDGLQRSTSLAVLSLAHCTRLWSIAALADVAPLRVLDVSRTPLTDAGLLRFVFPSVVAELIAQQLGHAAGGTDALARACAADPARLVPSRVEELFLYQCTALRYVGCLAHLPRLRRLNVSHTVLFDRGFVGFFAGVGALLRTQMMAGAAGAATSWAAEEEGRGVVRTEGERATAPLPDEAALMRAWRSSRQTACPRAPSTTSAASAPHTSIDSTTGSAVSEFIFDRGAARSLMYLSFAYCAEVRNIAPCALFHRLTALDLSGTAVDSPALLLFVNTLHECCSTISTDGKEEGDEEVGSEDGSSYDEQANMRRLVMGADGLHAELIHHTTQMRGTEHKASTLHSGKLRSPQRCRRPYTLTSLTLSFCHYVTDVRCCATVPSLEHLTLCGTDITNASIAAFAAPPDVAPLSRAAAAERRWWWRHQCALRSMDLRYCRQVTDVTPLLLSVSSLAAPTPYINDDTDDDRSGGSDDERRVGLMRGGGGSTLQTLWLADSGVAMTKEELQLVNPRSHCVCVL